ncbi:hypothetical protein GCM10011403_10510 [Pseudohongiella nitratireducens]|uniref:Uncharacterized protein n=1 Tax=Pseudohongiella nitratireducens TaxID=1768907 RepID=A0A917GST4_9GAMM|nr:hypothetical protein GCM10011403_10510 [Pseudohongiella nitratireducens]
MGMAFCSEGMKGSHTVVICDRQVFQSPFVGPRKQAGWGEVAVGKMCMAVEVNHGAQITPATDACKCRSFSDLDLSGLNKTD